MKRLSSVLTQRLDGVRSCQIGISVDDICNLTIDAQLVKDIFECLKSDAFIDQQIALLFAETLLVPERLSPEQSQDLISIVTQILNSKHGQVHGPALAVLGRFKSQIMNYRAIMLNALLDDDPMARRQALVLYTSYCRPRETEPLETFENDNYITEISMGGPLVYDLRNLAFEIIEVVIGRQFQRTKETKSLENGKVVYWWGWSPYFQWKKSWLRRLMGY